jgi:NADPH-dependent glutamate synthase beta subunit-like oxidoreductase
MDSTTKASVGLYRVPMRELAPEKAVKSFAEVSLGYSRAEAIDEAKRADGADLSGAQRACPFGVDVPELVRLVRAGDFEGALSAVVRAHPWPGVMGRWCHRPCEAAHSLGQREPLNIGGLERAAADHGDRGRPAFIAGTPSGKSVAILGAGSAGSSAAYRLRQHGHSVAVFDQLPIGGGMKTIGFPDFRLPLSVVQRDNAIAEWGVETHFSVEFDRSLVERLLRDYDAVIAASGKFKGVQLGIPGEELAGVYDALDFLTRVKLGRPVELGRRVAVLGAGYSAQDASRSARRMGSEVTIYYRRSEEDMPVRPERRAVYLAQQQSEGAPYVFRQAPVRIVGAEGKVAGVELVCTEAGAPDESGRPAAVPVPGSEHIVACDTVIAAIGEICDFSFLPPEVRKTEGGHIWIDPQTFQTSVQRLYAVGEMTGLKGTVAALRTGLVCGDVLDRLLRQQPAAKGAR